MIAALINHLWQSTLFCGGAWLITLLLRENSAALRHTIWLIASLKFLVPFSLLFHIGSFIGLPVARTAASQPLVLGDALQSAAAMVSPGALPVTGAGAESLTLALFALWIVGALSVALRWGLAWHAADSMARAARPAPGAPPDARITDADIEPAVARVFDPVVLLPAALLGRLSDPEMRAVLAHEREHIVRRDNLKANLHRMVETLFWFHPAVWWIGRRMLEERERACDEAVLGNGHDPADYAAGILAVCRHCRAGVPIAAAATSGNLTRRIRCILGSGQPATLGAVKTLALLVAMVCVAAAPLVAGAVDGSARRQRLLAINSRVLWSADISIAPTVGDSSERQRVSADQRGVLIRNSTLRDLLALAYGVERREVYGGSWLDSPRYDVRVTAQAPVSEPDDLDPHALRGAVTRLIVSRFGVEIHVNQRCQNPCGRYALATSNLTR